MSKKNGKKSLDASKASALAVMAFSVINGFVMMRVKVPSGSMEGTIHPGDRLTVDKLAYRFGPVKRKDIIVFQRKDKHFIKRVIGLPEEHLKIEDGKVYIDGQHLCESYLREPWTRDNDGYEFQIPEDSYFVMGDNRNNSWDSRFWEDPFVRRKDIEGKAQVRYWPLDSISKVR